MAAPARRSVVFVTGNAKKLEEVGGGGCGLAEPGPGPEPDRWVSLRSAFRRSLRSWGTPLPTRWWRRKLTVSWRRGPGGRGGAARLGPAVSSAPTFCVPSAGVPGGAGRDLRAEVPRSRPAGRSLCSFPLVGAVVWVRELRGTPGPGGASDPALRKLGNASGPGLASLHSCQPAVSGLCWVMVNSHWRHSV